VRRIIDGEAYDTDKSTRVVGGDNGGWSDAWWGLYRTEGGIFFKIVVDHDGSSFVEFRALTDAEARADVEKHANHLVEKYFGPAPEVGERRRPMRFSRRTVIAAIGMLERLTQAKLTRFLYELGPEFPRWAGNESLSLPKRLNNVIGVYDQSPERLVSDGEALADVLVEKAMSLLIPDIVLGDDEREFRRRLAIDGFVLRDGNLLRALPEDLRLPAVQDELSRLLKKHSLIVPQGHLDQAVDAHSRGNWASANSQIRTFLESLFDEMAARLDPATAAVTPSGHQRRQLLANIVPAFLDRTLNEWGDNGVGFVNGLMFRLHPQGSHPGLSDEEDSTFRLHVVLLTARLMLVRFDMLVAP
jgi:hypothetical protein